MRKEEGVREEGKGHVSYMHHCSLHTGQFIKIIKASLALKVEPAINLTGRQKQRLRDGSIVRQIHKTNARYVSVHFIIRTELLGWS